MVFHNGDDKACPTVEQIMEGVKTVRHLSKTFDRQRWEHLAEESRRRDLTPDEKNELMSIMERGQRHWTRKDGR